MMLCLLFLEPLICCFMHCICFLNKVTGWCLYYFIFYMPIFSLLLQMNVVSKYWLSAFLTTNNWYQPKKKATCQRFLTAAPPTQSGTVRF